MNKYILILTTVLSLSAASAQESNANTIANAVVDTQLSSTPITLKTGSYKGSLSSVLFAIAEAAGYGLVLESDVDSIVTTTEQLNTNDNVTAPQGTESTTTQTTGRNVVYSFNNQPFSQVWPFLMDVNGLSYEVVRLGNQPVLRVTADAIQRIIPLQYANANEATTQAKLFFGTPVYSESDDKKTRTITDVKLDSKTLRLVPDPRTNSVIARGTNKELNEVTRLLQQIDEGHQKEQEAEAQRVIEKGYTVKGSKETIEQLIKSQYPTLQVSNTVQPNLIYLVGPKKQVELALKALERADAPAAPAKPTEYIYSIQGSSDGLVNLIKSRFSGLQVLTFGQSKQIILAGDETKVSDAVKLLTQIDRPIGAVSTTQRTFQLVHASAEEVKATLENTLSRNLVNGNNTPNSAPARTTTTTAPANANTATTTTTTVPTTPAAQSAQSEKEEPATIIADRRTNTLIVRGTQLQVAQIADLIPSLDRKVPQINIQVRIQELSNTASRDLGLNARTAFNGFDIVSSSTSGLVGAFNPLNNLVGFNIFPTLTALEKQNMAKRVYDGGVTMLSGQRSLGSGSTAGTTVAANIKSGGVLEINKGSGDKVLSKTLPYGLELDFFNPQVSPDGDITVGLRGRVSTLLTDLKAGGNAEVIEFENNEAQTTITFKDGETLMLGGLMTNTSISNNSGIPYLSKIGLGNNKTNSEAFSQLLIVVTGTIVK